MFLTALAKQLLDEGKIAELQSLPINQLLAGFEANQLTEYGFVREHLDEAIIEDSAATSSQSHLRPQPSVATAYPNAGFRDVVEYSTIKDAVVISSGHIYSRTTVDQLLLQRDPKCPNTREPINPDKIAPLPQIDYAIKLLKFEKSISYWADQRVQFIIIASSNKFRIKYTELTEPGTPARLVSLLSDLFEGKNNRIITQGPQGGYSQTPWNRAWRDGQIEFWFPQGFFSNDDAGKFVETVTKPLNLPAEAPVDDTLTTYDMRTGGCRTYIEVFSADVTYQQIASCIIALILFSDDCRRKQGVIDSLETIRSSNSLTEPRVELGQGIFGQQRRHPGLRSIASSSVDRPRTSATTQNIPASQRHQ